MHKFPGELINAIAREFMQSEKITLGRVVVAARRQRGLSQAELAKHLRDQMGSGLKEVLLACDNFGFASPGFDFRHLSKIENDRVNVGDRGFDCFIRCFAEWAEINAGWLEKIRKQTKVKR